MADRDELKRAAAERAVEFVESGMVLGLGTGSTAAFFVEALAARVGQGLSVIAIPTSERTAAQAHRLGIPLASFAEHRQIDLAIDGADEVQRISLDLIKGRGGALLREKTGALPVEVAQFGWEATGARLEELDTRPELRCAGSGEPFVTDGGNFILDCLFASIEDPAETERRINAIVGVVENGLFVGRSSAVIVASEDGVEILTSGGTVSR